MLDEIVKEYDKEILRRNSKRQMMIENLPLAAYTSVSWFLLYKKLYKEVIEKDYKNANGIEYNLRQMMNHIKIYVYPEIFHGNKRSWSAREFAYFIKNNLIESKLSGTGNIFSLLSFSPQRDQKIFSNILKNWDRKILNNRAQNAFNYNIYIPFYNLVAFENDLVEVFDLIGEKNVSRIVFNYGIPNYVKYVSIKNKDKINNKEAIYISIKRIMDFYNQIYSMDKDLAIKMLIGFFRTSILWEPYRNVRNLKDKQISFPEVTDWRRYFKKLIEEYGVNKLSWWKEKEETDALSAIPAVVKMFRK